MKVLLLLVLIVGTLAQLPTDSCSLCTALVNGLEDYVSLNNPRTKESLMNGLQKIQNDVCPHIWGNYLTAQQCSDYISLYGSYVVDLFLSEAQSSSICKALGLCQSSTSDADYKIVFPSITNQSIVYQTPFTKVITAGSQYFFKFFLGNPKFEEELLWVELLRGDKAGCTFSLEISNKTDFTRTVNCTEKTCKCAEEISHPGRGVWYYVSINTTQILNPTLGCSFGLKATLRPPVPPPHFLMIHGFGILLIILPILLCFFFCCCCCVCLKRRCRSKGCRFSRRCGKQQEQVETGAIAMQPINAAAAVPETAVPMGYYYVPTFAGSYVPLSQDAQPVAYPQFVPVQQE
jgi:hypothetical protein